MGCPWGYKESDIAEQLTHTHNYVTLNSSFEDRISVFNDSLSDTHKCWDWLQEIEFVSAGARISTQVYILAPQ